MPTYNRAALLQQTLEILLPQISMMDNVEVIISDNASSDRTAAVVEGFVGKYPCIRFLRNEQNLGADDNALLCLKAARGSYVWFCSDDDIPLPGTVENVIRVLKKWQPKLALLNHTGFLECESYKIVQERGRDVEDEIYHDGEQMMLRHTNHFSATILRRSATDKYLPLLAEYRSKGHGQGYACGVLCLQVQLDRAVEGVCVFIGKNGLAVNNPVSINYDTVKVIIIDVANSWQDLCRLGKISPKTESLLMNWMLRCALKLLIALKAKGSPEISFARQMQIVRLTWRYRGFYTGVLPVLLIPGAAWAAVFFPVRWFVRQFKTFPRMHQWYVRWQFNAGVPMEKSTYKKFN
jgi:glycosyltransferase involved in cell wall biosynthesis